MPSPENIVYETCFLSVWQRDHHSTFICFFGLNNLYLLSSNFILFLIIFTINLDMIMQRTQAMPHAFNFLDKKTHI